MSILNIIASKKKIFIYMKISESTKTTKLDFEEKLQTIAITKLTSKAVRSITISLQVKPCSSGNAKPLRVLV